MADIYIETVINLDGLDVVEAILNEGSKKAAKKFLRKVDMKAAKVLLDALKANAPHRTDALELNIKRQTVTTDDAITVRVGPSQNVFYGAMLEWGAPEANVPAEHWAEFAAIGVQDKVLEEFYAALQEGLEDMAEKSTGPNLGGRTIRGA
jgi:HK97 gp10 family phage protein